MHARFSISRQDLIVAAVVLMAGLPCTGYSADAATDAKAKRAPALYLSEGITESQVQAVIEDIGDEMPSGAALWIGLVAGPIEADGNSLEWGPRGDVPDGFSIRPLDDPSNPYKDQYGPWDTWEYENYLQLCQDYGIGNMTRQERWDFFFSHTDDPRLDITQWHALVVSGDGFVIPCVVANSSTDTDSEGSVFSFGGATQYGGDWLGYYVSNAFSFNSCGRMDESLLSQRDEAIDVGRAPNVPLIPQWLAENPPMSLMFIPEDRFITFGPLGSWDDQETLSEHAWFCFNWAGELIAKTAPDQQWWFEMFFPGFRQTWDSLGGIPNVQFDDAFGMIRFYRQDTQEDLAYYDYYGTQLKDPYGNPDVGLYMHTFLFQIFQGSHIPAMYAAQQEQPAQ